MLRIRELEPADADFLGVMLYEAIYWDPAKERLPAEFVLAHPQLTIFHAGWGRPGDTGLVAEVDGEPAGSSGTGSSPRTSTARGSSTRRRPSSRSRSRTGSAARESAGP